MSRPLCVDCRWHVDLDGIHLCHHPKNMMRSVDDLIVGSNQKAPTYRYEPCWAHREDNWFNSLGNRTCGARGRWFEKRED